MPHDMNRKNSKKLINIVTSTESFLLRNLAEKFQKENYDTMFMEPSMEALGDLHCIADAFLLYLDDGYARNMALLVSIKDHALGNNIPLFIVGKPDDISFAEEVIPASLVKGSFMRPIDLQEVFHHINEYLNFFNTVDRKVILVVDDSTVNLRTTKELFEDKYNVMLAESAAMALKCISLQKPDLILLDYDMPIVDGKQVFEMIKSENDFRSIPVMFLTGMNDSATVKEIMQLHPCGYILKSNNAKNLVDSVENFFNGGAMVAM